MKRLNLLLFRCKASVLGTVCFAFIWVSTFLWRDFGRCPASADGKREILQAAVPAIDLRPATLLRGIAFSATLLQLCGGCGNCRTARLNCVFIVFLNKRRYCEPVGLAGGKSLYGAGCRFNILIHLRSTVRTRCVINTVRVGTLYRAPRQSHRGAALCGGFETRGSRELRLYPHVARICLRRVLAAALDESRHLEQIARTGVQSRYLAGRGSHVLVFLVFFC